MTKKLYKDLGLEENATAEQIRKAYRKLALQYHPDKNKEPGADVQFRVINEAYKILGDEETRKKYDAGSINDEGLPPQNEPAFNPQERARKHSRHSSEDYSWGYQPFFANPSPRPAAKNEGSAFYYFFNSEDDATQYHAQNEEQEGPTFYYVTPSPLIFLFTQIHEELTHNRPKAKETSHTQHTRQHDINRDTTTYNAQTEAHPAHVSVETNNAPRMEKVIDILIGQLILLVLLEQLSQNVEQYHAQESPSVRF